jgi:CubicO group peptidase (beta-lactamase class C family)
MASLKIASRRLRTFLFSSLVWPGSVAACQAPAIESTTATALDPVRARDEAIDAVFAAYAHEAAPGCAVGVYEGGQIVHARGFGSADLEHDVPITDSTVFDLGSVSKQLTAAAILLLAQDGKLSLDDDVRDYVPELPVYGKPITLRHLLHHTSGLRDYTALLAIDGHDDADLTTDDDALFAITHQRALNFPTGSEWSYSNTGYFLLALVVRRVTGTTLATFEKERIFDPLGMTDTHVHEDHRRIVPRRAIAYARGADGAFGLAMSDFEQTGDGAVMTTARDLARWNENFRTGKVGGPSMLATLRTRGKLDDGRELTYAMGLVIDEVAGLPREWHGGSWAGYRAAFLRFPGENVAVAVLCNRADATPVSLAMDVARVMVPELGATAARTAPEPRIDPAVIAGSYLDRATFEVRSVRAHDGILGLRTSLDGAGERQLVPVDERTFAVKGTTIQLRWEPASKAQPPRLVERQGDAEPETFERFEPESAAATGLSEYAGRYESDEMTTDMTVAVRGENLVLSTYGRAPSATLHPLLHDAFEGNGAGYRFERDGRGQIVGLVLSANRMHGLRWQKR